MDKILCLIVTNLSIKGSGETAAAQEEVKKRADVDSEEEYDDEEESKDVISE